MATKTLDDMMTTLPLPKGGKRLNFDDEVKPLPNPKPTKATDLGKYATPLKKSGTSEGTDQSSAEKNLRQDYENMKADERQKKAYLIAKEHLGSSFNIFLSNGYKEWKSKTL
jgi:hypothetical protein